MSQAASDERRSDAGVSNLSGPGAFGDRIFQGVAVSMAVGILVLLGAFALVLFVFAEPAIARYGSSFLVSTDWDPVFENFGAAHFAYGTVVTSLVAVLLATPIAVGAALFISEYAPDWLAEPVGFIVEMLAVVPSIIYGLWAVFVMAPVMRAYVEPFLRDYLGPIPVIGALFSGPILGRDLLNGGVILAIMILPTIMSISREILRAVPDTQREGMLAIGATKWETIVGAVLPYARVGIAGGIVLGLARAVGETMAVTMVIGNSSRNINASLFTPGYTMASAIANQFTEADKEIYFSAIVLVALSLMVVSLFINLGARFVVWRFAPKTIGEALS